MNEFLQTLLYATITTTLPLLVGYVISYIKTKRDEKLLNIDNTYITETIKQATDLIMQVVDTITQTYVDDLKIDGKFDETKQKEALEKALNQAKKLMNDDMASLVSDKYNDLDLWIRNTIEAYIKSTNNPNNN